MTAAPLPEQAVDPQVLELIRECDATAYPDGDRFACGCRMILDPIRWALCDYHDGINVGLAMAAPEIERLRDWKESALVQLSAWDEVFEALGRPGPLGRSMQENALVEIQRLVGGGAKCACGNPATTTVHGVPTCGDDR